MILADGNIKACLQSVANFTEEEVFPAIEAGKLVLHPMPELSPKNLGPASLDLRLGRTITLVEPPLDGLPVNVADPQDRKRVRHTEIDITEKPFTLLPLQFVLGMTYELIGMSVDLVGFLRDKSSLARHGVTVCLNSPKIDPGFYGTVALEINNRSRIPVLLTYRMSICQLVLHMMASRPIIPYHRRTDSQWCGQRSAIEKW